MQHEIWVVKASAPSLFHSLCWGQWSILSTVSAMHRDMKRSRGSSSASPKRHHPIIDSNWSGEVHTGCVIHTRPGPLSGACRRISCRKTWGRAIPVLQHGISGLKLKEGRQRWSKRSMAENEPGADCQVLKVDDSKRLSAATQVLRLDDSCCRHRTLSDLRPGCPLCLRTCHSRAINWMTAICRRAGCRPAAALAGGELELPTPRCQSNAHLGDGKADVG